MGGRVYDYNVGRFLSVDPFIQGSGSQGINPYSYILNNPLAGTDPSGYVAKCSIGGEAFCNGEEKPENKKREKTDGRRGKGGGWETVYYTNGAKQTQGSEVKSHAKNSTTPENIGSQPNTAHQDDSTPDSIEMSEGSVHARQAGWSDEKKKKVIAKINEMAKELMKQPFSNAQEAAAALHDSGLVEYANAELKIEFYAIISGDDNSILSVSTNFNTGRVYPEEDANFNVERGDSVWHTHPNGTDIGKSDWGSLVMRESQHKGWVFASGKRLTGYQYSGASNSKTWYKNNGNFRTSEHSALKYTRHYNSYWTSERITFNKGQ